MKANNSSFLPLMLLMFILKNFNPPINLLLLVKVEGGVGGGGVALAYKMGMYVLLYVKKRGLTELIKLKKWVLSELETR